MSVESLERLGSHHVGMYFEGDPDSVIGQIIDRHNNPQSELNGQHEFVMAVEGGGYSAIVPAAMLVVMEQAGLNKVFGMNIGTSIGALDAAYATAEQSTVKPFFDLRRDRQFARLSRALVGRSPINLGRLMCNIIRDNNPLDFDKLKNSPSFGAVAANIDTGQAELLTEFDTIQDLMLAVRASMSVPGLTGRPIKFRGKTYSDGGLVDPTAVKSALEHGSPDNKLVLVLRTCGEDLRKEKDSRAQIQAVRWHPHGGKALAELVSRRVDVYNGDAGSLQAGEFQNVAQIALKGSMRPVPRVTRSAETLLGGLVLGVGAAGEAFGMPKLLVRLDEHNALTIRTDNSRPKNGVYAERG